MKLDVRSDVRVQNMPTALHGPASIAIDNDRYVIGGVPQPSGSATNLNEILTISKE